MDFDQWELQYERILRRFGFSRLSDEEGADELRTVLGRVQRPLLGARAERALRGILLDRRVLLVGAGPGPLPCSALPSPGESREARAMIAADGATTRLLELGRVPDLIVTDLDGYLPDEIEANQRGALVLVHAHGDNRRAVLNWVPQFPGAVAGSCAGPPGRGLINPGGFTDGDRALFVAEEYGARNVLLACYDFDRPLREPVGTRARKAEKLRVARDLVDQVARRGRVGVEVLGGDGTVSPWSPGPLGPM